MGLVIAGFPASYKVPGGYGEVLPSAGSTSAQSIPIKLLLMGLKTAAGVNVADVDIVPITSPGDAVTAFGGRARITRMARIALLQPSIQLFGIATAEAGGATAATFTITIAGTWTKGGTYSYRLEGELVTGVWGSADLFGNVATNIAASFNANPNLCYVASAALGVVTLTAQCKGATSNRDILFDVSVPPAGGTSTISGGAAVTGGGIFPAAGTGTEDITASLATIVNSTYDRIVLGCVDGANALKLSNQLVTQAGVLTGRLQHGVFASNDTYANAQTIAQTTLNAYRMQAAWQLNGETHPGELAAALGAVRVQREQNYPNANFDGVQLLGVAPQSQKADWPNTTTQNTALNNGVTPITTTPDGKSVVARSIVTHCLNGSTPDFNTLDTAQAVVPDFVLTTELLAWAIVQAANVVAGDNTAFGDKRAPTGVITPDVWNAKVYSILKALEHGDGFPGPVLENVDANPPVSNWDSAGLRIMTTSPAMSAPQPHQLGVSVRPLQPT